MKKLIILGIAIIGGATLCAHPRHGHHGNKGLHLATDIVNLVGASVRAVTAVAAPRPAVVVHTAPAPAPAVVVHTPPPPPVIVHTPPPPPRPVVIHTPPPPPRHHHRPTPPPPPRRPGRGFPAGRR